MKTFAIKSTLLTAHYFLVALAAVGLGSASNGQEPTPEELVTRLNSPNFQERETAEKGLRVLGAKAVAALKAGLVGGSPEGVERCSRVLAGIRKDDLARFVKLFGADSPRTAAFDHPVWVRWAKVVGDDHGSRELLAEVLAATGAADVLDRLEADPKAAADLYTSELARLHGVAIERAPIDAKRIRSPSSCYSIGEAVYGVYLGTYPGAASMKPGGAAPIAADPEIAVLESTTNLLWQKRGPWSAEAADKGEYQWGNRPLDGPKHRIMAASLLNLRNPRAIEIGLRRSGGLRDVRGDLAFCQPLARMVCREKAFPVNVRAASWPYLAEAGETDFLVDMAALQADTTRVQQFWRSDESGREYSVLVSDVSIACQLLMHKQALKDFGFLDKLNEEKRRADKSCFAFGFPDEATRKAAHALGLAFLAKVPTPKPLTKPK